MPETMSEIKRSEIGVERYWFFECLQCRRQTRIWREEDLNDSVYCEFCGEIHEILQDMQNAKQDNDCRGCTYYGGLAPKCLAPALMACP